MTIDLPHMLATGAIIFFVLWTLEQSGMLQGASKLKRILVIFVSLFIVLLMLNLIWPYGGAAVDRG